MNWYWISAAGWKFNIEFPLAPHSYVVNSVYFWEILEVCFVLFRWGFFWMMMMMSLDQRAFLALCPEMKRAEVMHIFVLPHNVLSHQTWCSGQGAWGHETRLTFAKESNWHCACVWKIKCESVFPASTCSDALKSAICFSISFSCLNNR